MGTTSNRSSGTQVTPKGINQGNVLVDPLTGLPISTTIDTHGLRRLAVDADITLDDVTIPTRFLSDTTDSVAVGDPNTGAHIKVNNDGSIDTNVNINASTDNIAIADASSGNKLLVNNDGSINVNTASTSATTPFIFNVTVILANTEVSQVLPSNTKQFTITVRNSTSKLQFSFTLGGSGTNYITVPRGSSYKQEGLNTSSITLYFQTNQPSQVVEILSWS